MPKNNNIAELVGSEIRSGIKETREVGKGEGNPKNIPARGLCPTAIARSTIEIEVNEITLEPPEHWQNNLKGISPAYSPHDRDVFAAGILTENTAVLSLTPPRELDRTMVHVMEDLQGDRFIGENLDSFRPKLVRMHEGSSPEESHLWIIDIGGTALFAIPPGAFYAHVNGIFYQDMCFSYQDIEQDVYKYSLPSSINSPISGAVVNPNNGDLFVSVWYDQDETTGDFTPRMLLQYRFDLSYIPSQYLNDYGGWVGTISRKSNIELLTDASSQLKEFIVDMGWDPEYSWISGNTGALVVLIDRQNTVGNTTTTTQWLRYIDATAFENYAPGQTPIQFSTIDTSVEWFEVELQSYNAGDIRNIWIGQGGYTFLVGNSVWEEANPPGSGDTLVTQGKVVLARRQGQGLTQLAEAETDLQVAAQDVAFNGRTMKFSILYRRHQPALGLRESYDPSLATFPNYYAWVNIYHVDIEFPTLNYTLELESQSRAGIESEHIVAIDGEDDTNYGFAVGNAGGASIVFVPGPMTKKKWPPPPWIGTEFHFPIRRSDGRLEVDGEETTSKDGGVRDRHTEWKEIWRAKTEEE